MEDSPDQMTTEVVDAVIDDGSNDETVPNAHAVPPTERVVPPEEGPTVAVEAPASLQDVAKTAGSFLRGRAAQASAFLARHALVVGVVAIALVGVIFAATLSFRGFASLPDEATFRRDAMSLVTPPEYNGGTYGSDDPLALTALDVTSQKKDPSNSNALAVTGVATFSNGTISALQEVSLSYERSGNGWSCTNAETTGGASFTTSKGIDRDKVAANIDEVLQRADASFADDGSEVALPTLYAGADVQVTDETFDEASQTDDVTLHLSRSTNFVAYECDVHAAFSFRPGNGMWELTSASASGNAKEISLAPLLGTWTGSFVEQESTTMKCFGAKEQGAVVTINTAERGHLAGTISCVAHYHGDLEQDVDTYEGDRAIEEVPFTGNLTSGGAGLTFECTTPEDASGSVSFVLTFGQSNDPSSALATVTTRHVYTETFLFIPFEYEAAFTDTYALSKQ